MVNSNATRKSGSRRNKVYIPSIRTLTRKNCPSGMVLRKGYTRRYSTAVAERGFTVRKKAGAVYRIRPKSKTMYVEPTCIKNTGLSGKVTQSGKKIGPLRKGELKKYGYSYLGSESERHGALKNAVKAYGRIGVYRKLDAVAKLTSRTIPEASRIFAKNRNWVKNVD